MESDLEELVRRTVEGMSLGEGVVMSRWVSILTSTIDFLIRSGTLDLRGLPLLLRLFWQAGKDDLNFDGTDQDNCVDVPTEELYRLCVNWLNMFNKIVDEEVSSR